MLRSAIVAAIVLLALGACRKDPAWSAQLDHHLQLWVDSSCFQAANVFTPDGDGINDAFFVMATNIQSLELTVRAGDGHVVFSTNDPHAWWNGVDPGNPSAGPIHGTYKYLLHATTDQGSIVEASRRIVLVTDHYTQCIDASIEPVFGDMFDPRWCMPIYATNDLVCVE